MRHRVSPIRFVAVLIAVLLAVSPLTPERNVHAQGGEVSLVGLAVLLGQLRQNLDAVLGTVDAAAAARIRQLELLLSDTTKKVDDVIQKGFNQANVTREELYGDVFSLLSSINSEIQRTSRVIFIQTNITIVHIAELMDSLPFVKIKPSLFTVDPYPVKPNQNDRLISFYGYFPDVTQAEPATVQLKGKTYTLSRYDGYRIGFEVPANVITQEQTFLDMTLTVRRRHIFKPPIRFKSRLYIERAKPYTFEVVVRRENPKFVVTIRAPQQLVERADSSRTTNNQTLPSSDVFSRLVGDNTRYDMSSAKFAAMDWRIDSGNKPCDCCSQSSGSFDWREDRMTFFLNAPTCQPQWCSPVNFCGGGGTHSDLYATPTFRVNSRSEPADEESARFTKEMPRNETDSTQIDPKWLTVFATGRFKDGDDNFARSETVTRGVYFKATELWTARVENDRLVLETFAGAGSSAAPASFDLLAARESTVTQNLATETAQMAVASQRPPAWPFYVYRDDQSADNHYVPTGVMFDGGDLTITTSAPSGAGGAGSAIKVTYRALGMMGKAAMYWQDPPRNWGEQEGGYDLRGAKVLKFLARGEAGGEVISEFRVGGIGITGGVPHGDSAIISTAKTTLTKDWKEFEIALDSEKLQRIIGGFYFQVDRAANAGKRVVFYLDNIRFEQ